MKKILFLAFAAMAVITTVSCSKEEDDEAYIIPEGYVDLGLSSGTLWKITGENNGESPLFTYNQAVKKFGSELPPKSSTRSWRATANGLLTRMETMWQPARMATQSLSMPTAIWIMV